jgi:hypothetical protein
MNDFTFLYQVERQKDLTREADQERQYNHLKREKKETPYPMPKFRLFRNFQKLLHHSS